jgi:hypothetical protein
LGRVVRLLDHLPFFLSPGILVPRVEGEFVPVCLGVESFRGQDAVVWQFPVEEGIRASDVSAGESWLPAGGVVFRAPRSLDSVALSACYFPRGGRGFFENQFVGQRVVR